MSIDTFTISLAEWVVVAFGAWLIGVSILMLARPAIALSLLAKAGSTNLINYGEITLRLLAGMALVLVADISRFPDAFRIFGWLLAITSSLLYCVPRKWHAKYAKFWFRSLTPTWLRVAAPVSLAAGALIIYAVI